MDLKALLAKLDLLREDRDNWTQNGSRQRLTAKVGDLMLQVHNDPNGNTCWQVENPLDERVVQPWALASNVPQAMRDCTDFTRAYLLSLHEPAHLEH